MQNRAAQPLTSLTHSNSPPLSLCTNMMQLTAEAKHTILLEYQPHSTTHSFSALARRHSIAGGADVIRHWHDRWDGSASSLQRRPVSGRPRLLSRAQVSRHIRAPILAANRAHRAIHYTDLLPKVRQKTRTQLSIQTLRRYGKGELDVKQKRSKKRTADESQSQYTHERE
jgi:hypothetical protein